MGNLIVPVDSAMYSTLKIGNPSFPFALFHDDLQNFHKGFVNWHKQKVIEISVILDGSVKVCLLNETHILSAGEAFVILPDVMHSIQPVDFQHGRYFTFIFDPCLINGFSGSFFEQTYYEPVISSKTALYSFDGMGELRKTMQTLFRLYEYCQNEEQCFQLKIQHMLQEIWVDLFDKVFICNTAPAYTVREIQILHMIEYLHQHYSEKFSLSAMADHHHISRGECCRFFKKMMSMTISEYLLDYRLSRATELLRTQRSITDIAHLVGFRSSSNFSNLFKRKTGLSPSDYRAMVASVYTDATDES